VTINPAAGKPADPSILVNVLKLVTAYYELRPDPSDARQRVVFGTSGHRGSAFEVAFNEGHIPAITQAICGYRKLHNINGPLFLGMDTYSASVPTSRPAADYTPRLVPRHLGAFVPLETPFILWHQAPSWR